MGALEGGGERESAAKAKKKKKHRKKRRVGIKLDMTPMVDIAFLLLTFFMLTTTMSKPTTMEINLPPSDTKVEVAESNLLTLRVNEKTELWWNIGIDPPQKVEFVKLRPLLIEKSQANPKLITLLKVDRKAKYKEMVDIIDEFNLASISKFSISKMDDEDKKILEKVASGGVSGANK
jgi:biopolymer transport protein ExbD